MCFRVQYHTVQYGTIYACDRMSECSVFPPSLRYAPWQEFCHLSAFNLAKSRAIGIPNAARSATYKHRGVNQRHDLQRNGAFSNGGDGPQVGHDRAPVAPRKLRLRQSARATRQNDDQIRCKYFWIALTILGWNAKEEQT